MAVPSQRRPLSFESIEAIATEGEQLHAHGYTASGKWNLSQVCNHVSDWMAFPMDGFPRPNPLVRIMLWGMKVTFGRRQLAKMLTADEMKAGSPTLPETIARPDQDEAEAVRRLRETVNRLKTFDGTVHASPIFGPMDYETCCHLQRIHAALHFSFLKPDPSAQTVDQAAQ